MRILSKILLPLCSSDKILAGENRWLSNSFRIFQEFCYHLLLWLISFKDNWKSSMTLEFPDFTLRNLKRSLQRYEEIGISLKNGRHANVWVKKFDLWNWPKVLPRNAYSLNWLSLNYLSKYVHVVQSSCCLRRPQKLTKSSPSIWRWLIWHLLSKRQIDGENFVNFCSLLRKHELYRKTYVQWLWSYFRWNQEE